MAELYDSDLARIHDEGFGDLAEHAADFVIDLLRRRGIEKGQVLDLGCGAGQLAAALDNEGYDVWGADVSGPMLARARERVPSATFVQGSIARVALPDCVAATAVGEVLNYLPRRADVGTVFRRVHQALGPGGFFVMDVAGPGSVDPSGRRTVARVSDDWTIVARTRAFSRNRLERTITAFTRDGEAWRRSEERHAQLLYEPAALARSLRGVGFRVVMRRGHGACRLGRGSAVLIARKAA
jgi:SAM-dependent methyltransferase